MSDQCICDPGPEGQHRAWCNVGPHADWPDVAANVAATEEEWQRIRDSKGDE